MSQKNNSVYRTYGFWMSLSAAILLVVQTILSRMGIQIDAPFVQEVISGILAVLVILGVIVKPKVDQDSGLEELDLTEGSKESQTPDLHNPDQSQKEQ
ncbi:MAG TPA: phage holin [Clostridia bacterium]